MLELSKQKLNLKGKTILKLVKMEFPNFRLTRAMKSKMLQKVRNIKHRYKVTKQLDPRTSIKTKPAELLPKNDENQKVAETVTQKDRDITEDENAICSVREQHIFIMIIDRNLETYRLKNYFYS